MKHEDLAIGTYRRSVSSLIPNMTKIAFASYKDQIEQANPGTQKNKFLYRLNQTEYKKDFGTDYTHVGIRGQILAFVLRFVPKIGPFKALKVTIPNGQEQDIYLKSVNDTVDKFKLYLGEVHALPAPIPPPDPKDAEDARKAADKLNKDANKYAKLADKAEDPADKAKKEKVAEHVEIAAEKADATAERTQAKVDATQAATEAGTPQPTQKGAVPLTRPVTPPTVPTLPHLNLDTGRASAFGEYNLADQTYAHLLADLLKLAGAANNVTASVAPSAARSSSDGTAPPAVARTIAAPTQATAAPPSAPAPAPAGAAPAGPRIDPALAADIEHFFEHPVPRTGTPPAPKEAEREAALAAQVKANLQTLKSLEDSAAAPTGPQSKAK